jgi:hypothetical protein
MYEPNALVHWLHWCDAHIERFDHALWKFGIMNARVRYCLDISETVSFAIYERVLEEV